MIGSTLAHYRILAKLGEGGMGIVFLAEDERLHRKVALKMLPPALAADPHRLARFEREVKSVATLNHPNIVTIYSVEEADGKRFFTMEHVEGKTLSQMIPLGRHCRSRSSCGSPCRSPTRSPRRTPRGSSTAT